MNVGKRHRPAPDLGRHVFALMSVIALLALACFPVLAHAECTSSSCVQYTESIPKAGGENSPAQHKRPPIAKAADKGGTPAPDGKGSKESTGETPEEESTSKGGGAATTDNNNNGGTGQGNPGGSGSGKAATPVHDGAQPKGVSTSQSSDGGASPLIPILIAILALAAISVAAVMIRQKRQRRGPSSSAPSPKAS